MEVCRTKRGVVAKSCEDESRRDPIARQGPMCAMVTCSARMDLPFIFGSHRGGGGEAHFAGFAADAPQARPHTRGAARADNQYALLKLRLRLRTQIRRTARCV
eukprot:6182000-Pleurochrysis_carterae.AAC.5